MPFQTFFPSCLTGFTAWGSLRLVRALSGRKKIVPPLTALSAPFAPPPGGPQRLLLGRCDATSGALVLHARIGFRPGGPSQDLEFCTAGRPSPSNFSHFPHGPLGRAVALVRKLPLLPLARSFRPAYAVAVLPAHLLLGEALAGILEILFQSGRDSTAMLWCSTPFLFRPDPYGVDCGAAALAGPGFCRPPLPSISLSQDGSFSTAARFSSAPISGGCCRPFLATRGPFLLLMRRRFYFFLADVVT